MMCSFLWVSVSLTLGYIKRGGVGFWGLVDGW
jgi:hypothetical protein